MKTNSTLEDVVSFRLLPNEKQQLDSLIKKENTTKSDFLRQKIRQLLFTKNK